MQSEITRTQGSSYMKIQGLDWFAVIPSATRLSYEVDLLCSFDHFDIICCVKFSPDGTLLAVGSNQIVYIYNPHTFVRVGILKIEERITGIMYINSLAFSPDGRYLAVGADDKQIRIYDLEIRNIHSIHFGHEKQINSLEFSRDGRFLVSGSGDGSVRIWDCNTSHCLYILYVNCPDMYKGITSVAISPNIKLLAAASMDHYVYIWDISTGQLIERLKGHNGGVSSVAFIQDGKYLMSGSLDNTLRTWKLGTGSSDKTTCIKILSGHTDSVLSVATTPDKKWAVSASDDCSMHLWNPFNGKIQFMIQGHMNTVTSIDVSYGQRTMVVTGSKDRRARIWSYKPVEL